MPGPIQKPMWPTGIPKLPKRYSGRTKTKTARGGDDDDDGRRMEDRRRRKREGRKRRTLAKGDGRQARTKQLFRLVSRPCTMQNSASNSKAVRQSAASLFARCESSRFFKREGEANRSLNPNERLRAEENREYKNGIRRARTTPKGIFNELEQWIAARRPESFGGISEAADTSDRNYKNEQTYYCITARH